MMDLQHNTWSHVVTRSNRNIRVNVERLKLVGITKSLVNEPEKSGSCEFMCHPEEAHEREVEKDYSIFECREGKKELDHAKAVKKFVRPNVSYTQSLDTVALEKIRPIKVLIATLEHLMFNILDDKSQEYIHVFDFINDRARAICTDLTVQSAKFSIASLSIHERLVRFFILSEYILCSEPSYTKSKVDSEKQLRGRLTSCSDIYKECRRQGIYCPFEAELQSYMLLYECEIEFETSFRLASLTTFVRESEEVKFSLEVINAYKNGLFYRFFELFEKATILLACLMAKIIPKMKKVAFEAGRDWNKQQPDCFLQKMNVGSIDEQLTRYPSIDAKLNGVYYSQLIDMETNSVYNEWTNNSYYQFPPTSSTRRPKVLSMKPMTENISLHEVKKPTFDFKPPEKTQQPKFDLQNRKETPPKPKTATPEEKNEDELKRKQEELQRKEEEKIRLERKKRDTERLQKLKEEEERLHKEEMRITQLLEKRRHDEERERIRRLEQQREIETKESIDFLGDIIWTINIFNIASPIFKSWNKTAVKNQERKRKLEEKRRAKEKWMNSIPSKPLGGIPLDHTSNGELLENFIITNEIPITPNYELFSRINWPSIIYDHVYRKNLDSDSLVWKMIISSNYVLHEGLSWLLSNFRTEVFDDPTLLALNRYTPPETSREERSMYYCARHASPEDLEVRVNSELLRGTNSILFILDTPSARKFEDDTHYWKSQKNRLNSLVKSLSGSAIVNLVISFFPHDIGSDHSQGVIREEMNLDALPKNKILRIRVGPLFDFDGDKSFLSNYINWMGEMTLRQPDIHSVNLYDIVLHLGITALKKIEPESYHLSTFRLLEHLREDWTTLKEEIIYCISNVYFKNWPPLEFNRTTFFELDSFPSLNWNSDAQKDEVCNRIDEIIPKPFKDRFNLLDTSSYTNLIDYFKTNYDNISPQFLDEPLRLAKDILYTKSSRNPRYVNEKLKVISYHLNLESLKFIVQHVSKSEKVVVSQGSIPTEDDLDYANHRFNEDIELPHDIVPETIVISDSDVSETEQSDFEINEEEKEEIRKLLTSIQGISPKRLERYLEKDTFSKSPKKRKMLQFKLWSSSKRKKKY